MSTRSYMDHYYRDEYEYGLTQNTEFVTLSRAIDRGFHPEGFAPIDASPVNWVGDQKHVWATEDMLDTNGKSKSDIALKGVQGFESAIENVLESADLGYNIIGSDIGGFSGRSIPPRLYIRWTQFSTFCGLFLNGGHGERRLWKRTLEEMEIIRKYAWLHTELVPYIYQYVVSAHEGGRRLQTTLKKGKHHYMFGDDFLVAPIFQDSKTREVSLPEGKWRYFFDNSNILIGPKTFTREFLLQEYPVYIKEGAIIPLNVKRAYTGLGDMSSNGFTTFLIFPDDRNSLTYTDPSTMLKTEISYVRKDRDLNITLKGDEFPHILRIHTSRKPDRVLCDGRDLEPIFWNYDFSKHKISIRSNTESWSGNYVLQFKK